LKREYAKKITLMEYFFSEKGTTEFAVWVAGFLLGVFAILVLLVGYFVPSFMESLRFPCWINSRSGLLCPGCGGTRAFFYFLRGKWVSSFFMHPVVPYMGVLYLVYMFRGAIHFLSKGKFSFMRFRLGYIYAAIGVILVQFVLKNMFLLGIL
jgi:hypothetical protein